MARLQSFLCFSFYVFIDSAIGQEKLFNFDAKGVKRDVHVLNFNIDSMTE